MGYGYTEQESTGLNAGGAIGGYAPTRTVDAVASQSIVNRIQEDQARAIQNLEMQIKDLAQKLQPFLYDGPQNSAGPIDKVNPGTAPMPVLSSHLSVIAAHTQEIERISSLVCAVRNAVIR